MTPSAVQDYVLGEGYKAKRVHEDEESTVVESGVSGIPFSIVFFRNKPFDGDLDSYNSFLFSCGLSVEGKPDLNQINKANSESFLLKAHFDLEAIWVELPVPVPDGGLPEGMFEEYFDSWTSLLPDFVQELT